MSTLRRSRARKVPLFQPSKEAFIPSSPVITPKVIAVGRDHRELALLDRSSLALLHRCNVTDLEPALLVGERELMMWGYSRVGIFDLGSNAVRWHIETRVGSNQWNGTIVASPTRTQLNLSSLATGEVVRSVLVPDPPIENAVVCGDIAICRAMETVDPFRAISLKNGTTVWTRNWIAEVFERYGVTEQYRVLTVTPGSIADRLLLTRGGATFGCSLRDGEIVWKADVMVPYYSPLVEGGKIPVLASWNRFVVIDETTGALLVDRTFSELQQMYHQKRGSVVGDVAVFPSESGHVAAFNMKTGDLLFLEHHKKLRFWGSAVADGRVLISGDDGNLWVYEGLDTL